MRVVGVIAEFDPFHNGHAYFLRRVRELASADFIIAVMSGDFTQRGNIAIAGKRLRAEAALLNGADIVIELPVQYSTASAELFAMGGVSLLHSLGVVDTLCFGAEEEDVSKLKAVAGLLYDESEDFKEILGAQLKEGASYPVARLNALKETLYGGSSENIGAEPLENLSADELSDILCQPNNILAIEYLRALKRLDSTMDVLAVRRTSVDHDSTNTYGIYSSAKNIRNTLRITRSLDAVSPYLPENTIPLLHEHFGIDLPIFDDDLSSLMKYRLLMEDADSLMQYADMNSDLARRIINKRPNFISFSQFTELIKTRNLTYTRISRALLHVLLSIKKEDMRRYQQGGVSGYTRILGFKKDASVLIDAMKEKAVIPIISRTAEYKKLLKDPFDRMFADDLRASDIYASMVRDIYGTDIQTDLSSMAISKGDIVLT